MNFFMMATTLTAGGASENTAGAGGGKKALNRGYSIAGYTFCFELYQKNVHQVCISYAEQKLSASEAASMSDCC